MIIVLCGKKMTKLSDKLWNWGHLAGSHNKIVNYECKMSPQQYGEEYGVNNSFIVSYGGNIDAPFDPFAKRFSGLKEIKWSVVGNETSPLADDRLGYTNDIINVLPVGKNITGAVVDDFFSRESLLFFTN